MRPLRIKSRLLVFWMSMLALVLSVFSVSTFLIVRSQAIAHVNDQLQDILDDLALSVEARAHHPEHRDADLVDSRAAPGDMFWMIAAPDAPGPGLKPIQASPRWRRLSSFCQILDSPSAVLPFDDDSYLVLQKSVVEILAHPQYRLARPELLITAAWPLEKTQRQLRNLALALVLTSVAIWLVAFALGGWLVGSALAPLTHLAHQAESIGRNGLSDRLRLSSPAAASDEIALLAQSFNMCLARLETSFEQQRRFTTDASHELRTPLTIIQGEAELAVRRPRTDDEYRAVLQRVNTQAARLLDLIEKLLFLARPTGRENAIQYRSVAVGDLLNDLKDRWKSHARFADMQFYFEPEAVLRTVSGQPELLAVVLDNLVGNAAKFSPPGSAITIELGKSDPPRRGVSVTVTDLGPGIAPEVQSHLFTPFHRAPSGTTAACAGSGLGLSIAHRIVTLHGGRLQIESPALAGSAGGGGTHAAVWFPLDETAVANGIFPA